MRAPDVDADVVGGYLLLVLALDELVPGTVDGFGTAPWRERARAMPRVSPPDLVRRAGWLADALADAGLVQARTDFLRDQLRACEWMARRLAGQHVPYREELALAFGARVGPGSPEVYRAAHRALDKLLPGSDPLAVRLARYRVRDEIPPDRLGVAVRSMSAALRERTVARVPLPVGESVAYRIVGNAPWSALHHYRGGFGSRVTVNAGAAIRWAQLAPLLAHEAYPGHHTERCRKEAGLVAGGADEHRVAVANTPQSLVAEGAADIGLRAVVGPGWGRWAAEVLDEVAPGFDGELAERVDDASAVLVRVRQDAALLLHERRRPEQEVLDHLTRWALVGVPRARQVLRFLRDPLWRAYTTAYVEGAALVGPWWARQPDVRLRRMLDDPLTPAVLRAELEA